MSIPPFYIGQRVVAIEDHSQGAFKKGDEFTVTSILMGCCKWLITIGIKSRASFTRCDFCETRYRSLDEWTFYSKRFVPITEQFQAITYKEIMKKELSSVN